MNKEQLSDNVTRTAILIRKAKEQKKMFNDLYEFFEFQKTEPTEQAKKLSDSERFGIIQDAQDKLIQGIQNVDKELQKLKQTYIEHGLEVVYNTAETFERDFLPK